MLSGEVFRTGAWVFLSHSSKDWGATRRIRNYLEERGHRPLMFFLKCLSDESELDDLLRREIEARTWFLLCDSPNARASTYVQAELRHIAGLPGKCSETVDLGASIDEQLERIDQLLRRASVYLAYAARDTAIATRVRDYLIDEDYDVAWPARGEIGEEEGISAYLKRLMRPAIETGFILELVSAHSAKSMWVRAEMQYAAGQRGQWTPGRSPKVIPVVIERDQGQLSLLHQLPASALKHQTFDVSGDRFDSGMRELVQYMKGMPMD